MIRIHSLAALTIVVVLCAGAGQGQEKSTDVVPISYDQLKQEVHKHRGKVLIVDFWAGT